MAAFQAFFSSIAGCETQPEDSVRGFTVSFHLDLCSGFIRFPFASFQILDHRVNQAAHRQQHLLPGSPDVFSRGTREHMFRRPEAEDKFLSRALGLHLCLARMSMVSAMWGGS